MNPGSSTRPLSSRTTGLDVSHTGLSLVRRALAGLLAFLPACAEMQTGFLLPSAADIPTVTIDPVSSPEVCVENPLDKYESHYHALPKADRSGFSLEQVVARLNAHPDLLKKALAMQGGGQLFYIGKTGEIFIKDKGGVPVMYGFNAAGDLMSIYNWDPQQIEQVKKWANGPEIEAAVEKGGYHLFEDDGNYKFSELMEKAAASQYHGFLVFSNRRQYAETHLKNNRCVPMGLNFVGKTAELNGRVSFRGALRWISI